MGLGGQFEGSKLKQRVTSRRLRFQSQVCGILLISPADSSVNLERIVRDKGFLAGTNVAPAPLVRAVIIYALRRWR